MSSFDSIYKKLASSLDQSGASSLHDAKMDPARHIAPVVAHELNNILAIIQGYADRLLLKHEKDATLEPHLKLISEAARRATIIVRSATPKANGTPVLQPPQNPPPPPTTAV
jgi:signal transduction histidine kinase